MDTEFPSLMVQTNADDSGVKKRQPDLQLFLTQGSSSCSVEVRMEELLSTCLILDYWRTLSMALKPIFGNFTARAKSSVLEHKNRVEQRQICITHSVRSRSCWCTQTPEGCWSWVWSWVLILNVLLVIVSSGVSCWSSVVSCWPCRVPLEDELHVELEVLTYVTSGDDVELLVGGDSLTETISPLQKKKKKKRPYLLRYPAIAMRAANHVRASQAYHLGIHSIHGSQLYWIFCTAWWPVREAA